MAQSSETWEDFSRSAHPCQFPVLTEPLVEAPQTEWLSTKLEFEHKVVLLGQSQNHLNACTAFAILLSLFVGEDNVSFLSSLDVSTDVKAAAVRLVSVTVERQFKASDLIDACHRSISLLNTHDQSRESQMAESAKGRTGRTALQFNTSILVSDSEDIVRSTVSDMHPAVSNTPNQSQTVADRSQIDVILVVPNPAPEFKTELVLWYRPHLLSDVAAGTVLNTYGQILSEIQFNSSRPINDMILVSKQDIHLLTKWNSNVPMPSNKCVHQLFRDQVQLNPAKTAVCASDISLTYTELDAYATSLSWKLKHAGVGVGDVVLLCFEKSIWAVVSQLAVLKSGGACSYIHLEFPPARSQKIAEMSRARVALVSPRTASMLSHLDLNVLEVTQQSIEELKTATLHYDHNEEADPESPAFILFTSGSTGVPKGIIIDHSAVCTSFLAHGPIMMLKENCRVLQFAAYTWDASVAEIWTTLLFGGTVCVPSEEDRVDRLAQVINDFDITQVWLTPTVACLLNPDEVPSLKRLFLIGEPATRDSIDRWAERVDLRNAYGPTEACMFCSCSESLQVGCETRNVGYTFGSQVFAVDPDHPASLLPPGAIGELVVSGPIISRSYLDSPQETAAAFGARPDWPAETKISPALERIYRTGDLGRITAEGRIWHCGRRDNQVKLHGHRIQVDDIQHNLNRCLDFEYNIVVDVVQPDGDKTRPMLTAFVPISGHSYQRPEKSFGLPPTPDINQRIQSIARDLRHHGAEQLPAYMIPTLYLPVSHVPRSRSGKLDRKALKDYVAQRSLADLMAYSLSTKSKQQELTPKEEEFIMMLGDVLRIPNDMIRMSQNFVKLGGDSICAIKLADIGRRNGFDFSVAGILRAQSLHDLISTNESVDTTQELSPADPFELIKDDLSIRGQVVTETAQQCNVSPNCIQDIYPCTPLQEGMFVLSQKRPGSYIAQYYFHLGADIDLSMYKTVWQTVFGLFDILRTRIVYDQHAASFLQAVVQEEIQWLHESKLEAYLTRDETLNMGVGQRLTRFAIIQDNGSNHMVFTIHHALHDDWSLRLILENVSALCQSLDIRPSAPFRNFVKLISHSNKEQAMAHWTRELQGLDAPTFPPMPEPGYIPRATQIAKRQITRPSRHTRYTDATLFRAALCLLIAKYTNSHDVLFGANVAGRSVPFEGIQTLVGPTLTTVPVRVLLDFEHSIDKFLSQIQEQSNNSLEFEHTGLSQILQGTGIDFDFQTLLVVHLPTSQDLESMAQPVGTHITTGSYGLMLEVSTNERDCSFTATYDLHMIQEHQMQRFMDQFIHVLELLRQDDPSTSLSSISFCGPKDLTQISEWNRPSPKPIVSCVHQAFEEQVRRTPQASAIATYDREFTYGELNCLASTLAQHLNRSGVGPETIVPLCFGKSYLAIVAGLAVLKAGGGCTYLDPDYPQEMLLNILDQVGATTVICAESAKHKFVSDNNIHMIALSESWMKGLPETAHWSSEKVQPTNLAFVVFTSGTTGAPKGIVQDHQAYCSVMAHYGAALGFAPGRRVFQFSANTWDVFLSDIMTSLANGACVCIPSDEDRMSNLEESMCKLRVNQATLPPAVIPLLQTRNIPRMEVLCVGGDLVPSEVLRRWAHETRLVIMYGPSEVTVWSTFQDQIESSGDPRNIGKGSGSLVWLVEPDNPHLLAAVGTIGEIVLSGPGLARGYLKDEVRTKAAFMSAPKWLQQLDETQSRIYRTGDMGYYDFNGNVIFCGRRDNQIKLNGRRIELSGVQAKLEQSARGLNISQVTAEVIKPDCRPGEQYLTAFLAADTPTKSEMAFMVSQLRERLARVLPGFMIPTLFIDMDHFPLTQHGKLDRAKLHAHGSALRPDQLIVHRYTTEEVQRRNPSTRSEKRLQELWCEVLTIDAEAVSLDDSFWRLGGDSISAMKLVMLARSRNLSLTVRDILGASDLGELANIMDEQCT